MALTFTTVPAQPSGQTLTITGPDSGVVVVTIANGRATVTLDGRAVSLTGISGTITGVNASGLTAARVSIQGDTASSALTGSVADDTLNGGLGNDTPDGGAGNDLAVLDYLSTYNSQQIITIGSDRVSLRSGEVDNLVSIERINLLGSRFSDVINGSERDESLDGTTGADTINGGGGNDTIIGGANIDSLTGGAGNDQFRFYGADTGGFDQVIDFAQGDQLVFFQPGSTTATLSLSRLSAGSGTGLLAGQVHVGAINGGVRVFVGQDATAGFDVAVDLLGQFAPTDFEVATGGVVRLAAPVNRVGTSGPDILSGGSQADTLDGGAGDDFLVGGAGPDQLTGGAGVDAVGIHANARTVTVAKPSSGVITVTQTENGQSVTDQLREVELLFLADQVQVLRPIELYTAEVNAGYDESFYLFDNPDVAAAVSRGVIRAGYEHFVIYGKAEGRDPSILFDTSYYLARNPDVAAAVRQGVTTAVDHFSLYGWREGRDPSAAFDVSAYLERYPDVAAVGVNPLLHYIGWGLNEGRIITASDNSWIG